MLHYIRVIRHRTCDTAFQLTATYVLQQEKQNIKTKIDSRSSSRSAAKTTSLADSLHRLSTGYPRKIPALSAVGALMRWAVSPRREGLIARQVMGVHGSSESSADVATSSETQWQIVVRARQSLNERQKNRAKLGARESLS